MEVSVLCKALNTHVKLIMFPIFLCIHKEHPNYFILPESNALLTCKK